MLGGTSCNFTVSAVNSSMSITVSNLSSYNGGTGIAFSAPANAFWAVYTTALDNAAVAAEGASQILRIRSNYQARRRRLHMRLPDKRLTLTTNSYDNGESSIPSRK